MRNMIKVKEIRNGSMIEVIDESNSYFSRVHKDYIHEYIRLLTDIMVGKLKHYEDSSSYPTHEYNIPSEYNLGGEYRGNWIVVSHIDLILEKINNYCDILNAKGLNKETLKTYTGYKIYCKNKIIEKLNKFDNYQLLRLYSKRKENVTNG